MTNKPNGQGEQDSPACQIAADRAFAAEIRREYSAAARDYACFPEEPRREHRREKKVTAGAGIEPAPG